MRPTDRDKITGRFGVEIELNSPDRRNFFEKPLARGEMPLGIDTAAEAVRAAGVHCEVHEWRYNHNPSVWSCKPDNSCGMEVCSPVMEVGDLPVLAKVMDSLASESSLATDERCSFHVHLELSDMVCDDALGALLAWWVKCEHVFFDFAAPNRKNNRYCRPIGLTHLVDSDDLVAPEILFKKLSLKYLSLNTYHVFNRRRPTVEFRIAEGTKDSRFALNWIRLLLSFSSRAASSRLPEDYKWMLPEEIMDFMGLDSDLEGWFLARSISNCSGFHSEFFSFPKRIHALNTYSVRARTK